MLRLTDTRTRQVEDVRPHTPGVLTVYACGPTVYRYAHVGNLRTFLLSDLVRRTAEVHGLQVRLVQNITDVGHLQDDTGIDLSGEEGFDIVVRRIFIKGGKQVRSERFFTRYLPEPKFICTNPRA